MKQLLAATASIALFASGAEAATFLDSRAALRGEDLVDWAVLGLPFTPVSNPFSIMSEEGLELEVSIPTGEFLRLDQTPIFPGSFNVGDALLFTGLGNPGPLTLTFDQPVFGIGTQIQSDPQNIPEYTATITAFDSLGNLIDSGSVDAVSISDAGSGVPFLGFLDNQGDIKSIVFNALEAGENVPFAINAVSLRTTTPIPEPGVILGLFLIGLGGAATKLRDNKIS